MAEAFPRSRFWGIDLDRGALDEAEKLATGKGLANVRFVALDVARIIDQPEMEARFDYITAFDAIHDQTHPMEALRGALFMLKPGGLFSMIDIAAHSAHRDNLHHPMAPFLYTVSLMHCMPVGLADEGAGLGMMWGREKAVEMLREVGFSGISVEEIPDDPFNLHFQARKA
jgi:SAM-dependent methyltransferase